MRLGASDDVSLCSEGFWYLASLSHRADQSPTPATRILRQYSAMSEAGRNFTSSGVKGMPLFLWKMGFLQGTQV